MEPLSAKELEFIQTRKEIEAIQLRNIINDRTFQEQMVKNAIQEFGTIKELSEENKTLKEEIDSLKKEIKALKKSS